jgi:hypothetical protein
LNGVPSRRQPLARHPPVPKILVADILYFFFKAHINF